MKRLYLATASALLVTGSANSAIAAAQPPVDPFRFFEGVTETVGTLKIILQNPTRTHCMSHGELRPDGTLSLIENVDDEGHRPFQRRWLVRQIAPGHFVATMSQANGPVRIDEIGQRYRFRFRMGGSLSVEEWLTPQPDGRSATTYTTVHKFGIPVASSEGVVRKLS